MQKQFLKLPFCKNCQHIQIKLTRYSYDKCEYCNHPLEEKEFKEV